MRAGKPVLGARPLGADLNRPRLGASSPRTVAATPGAPTPLNPGGKVRAPVAPLVRPAQTGAPQRTGRQQEPEPSVDSSSAVNIGEDLRARIATAFSFPDSKRFRAHQGDKAKDTQRRLPAPEQRVRSPRNTVQSIKADAGRAQKPQGEAKAEKAKPVANISAVQEKGKQVAPKINKRPVQTKPGKAKPTVTRLPVQKLAENTKPTSTKPPVRATEKAKIKPKLANNARSQNAVAAAKAAPRPPLKGKQAPANLQMEESSDESESTTSIEGVDARKDNPLFRRGASSAVLERFRAYVREAKSLQPQYPTIPAAYRIWSPPRAASAGVSSSTPGSVSRYWSGMGSNYPTAIDILEDDEDDSEETNSLWMLDTDNLPQPPTEDDSIDRRMTMALVSTAALVATLTFVLIGVVLVSKFLKAGATT
ncbi:neurofilament heavy polypeptide-like [Dermacentor albipictus]|uniref:neurofilament heavy polypeptide-like n=1 Tax=Dermacentor albipictus TaxID=60249 RepID=UPI0038FC6D86